MSRARVRALAALAALLVAVACGSQQPVPGEPSKPPRQVLADAAAALRGTRFFHVGGTWSSAHGDTTPVDAQVARGGRVSIDSIPLIAVPEGTFVKTGGRWIRLPRNRDAVPEREMVAELSGDALARDWLSPPAGARERMGAPTEVGGVRAVPVGGHGVTVFVALDGPPYPLRVTSPPAGLDVRLDDFGAPVPIVAPTDPAPYSAAHPGWVDVTLTGAVDAHLTGAPETCGPEVDLVPDLASPPTRDGAAITGMRIRAYDIGDGRTQVIVEMSGGGSAGDAFFGLGQGAARVYAQASDRAGVTLGVTLAWSCR